MIWTSSSDSFSITTSLSLLRFLPRLLPDRLQLNVVNFEGSVQTGATEVASTGQSTTQWNTCTRLYTASRWAIAYLHWESWECKTLVRRGRRKERCITSYASLGNCVATVHYCAVCSPSNPLPLTLTGDVRSTSSSSSTPLS